MKNASIFLRNITCMDHAFIDTNGCIHGNSYHVSLLLIGEITEDESVVMDFSKAKKLIKQIIDDNDSGLDHKLLIFNNSNCKIDNSIITTISTPYLFLSGPDNFVHRCDCDIESLAQYMSDFVTIKLKENGFKIKCDITLDTNGFDKHGSYFNYAHGLKNSSSFGCKNLSHGHRSFVEVRGLELQAEIAEYLNDRIMIFKENIVSEDRESITISYTCERGKFIATYHKPHKWLIYDTETTIEYMINHVYDKFKNELQGKTLRISEGLQKGAQLVC